MFPKIWKKGTEMVKSFEYVGVVDGRSVEQDAEDEEDEASNSKGAVDKHPNELSVLLCLDRLYDIGETEKSSGC